MKQPKVTPASSDLPPPPPVSVGPRYRYTLIPPSKITLKVGDFIPHVPQDSYILGSNADRVLELDAREVLSGPVPKLTLGQLVVLAPESFRSTPESEKTPVRLPMARLAAGYQLVTQRNVVEEPWVNYVPLSPDSEELKSDSTAEDKNEADQVSESDQGFTPASGDADSVKFAPPVIEDATPAEPKGPAASLPPPPALETLVTPVEASSPKPPETEQKTEAPAPAASTEDLRPAPVTEPPAKEAEKTPLPAPPEGLAATSSSAESTPAGRGIFSVLPMFRRKGPTPSETPGPSVSPEIPPPVAIPPRRPRVELPPPKNQVASEERRSDFISASLRFAPKPPAGVNLPPPPASLGGELKAASPEPDAEELQKPSAPEIVVPAPEVKPVVMEKPPLPEPPPVLVPPIEPPAAPLPPPPLPIPVPEAEVEKSPEPSPVLPLVPAPEPEKPAVAKIEEPPAPPKSPKPEAAPAVLVETGKLPALANHDDLQAIFLTEEELSLERVVTLCGEFPGIQSCVLSQAGSVIASHNVPDSIDLVSLSAHALEMIRGMRESAAKMGVGAVPAVTIHSEKGPITFFHEAEICFLILHKDRGFVPGVREKLQQVVHHLAQSRLPRPVSPPARTLEG